MTTYHATMIITLGIAGPFLCSGTAPTCWGLDDSFDRDYLGRPYIDRTHLKGKLREALREQDHISVKDIDALLGKTGEEETGSLYFSDLRLTDSALEETLTFKPAEKSRTRTRLEKKLVDPGAMMVQEDAFPGAADKAYDWQGTLSFIANSKGDAEEICDSLIFGLKWIAAFGAEKGVGFGRLKMVKRSESTIEPIKIVVKTQPVNIADQLTIVVRTEDPLLIPDYTIKDNYIESLDYMPGKNLKAALAQAVCTALGAKGPLMGNMTVAGVFPMLAMHFDKIHFLHAFPSVDAGKRASIIPQSIVKAGNKHHDVALMSGPNEPSSKTGDQPWLFDVENEKKAPIFQTDWKDGDYPTGFGWAAPQRFAKTRTAINETTCCADEGRMFTCQYACPVTSDGEDIAWVGGVSLTSVPQVDRAALQAELESAFKLQQYLGKHKSKIDVTPRPEAPIPFRAVRGNVNSNGEIIVTLQSDAFMVDPVHMQGEAFRNNLHNLQEYLHRQYSEFWKSIDGSIELMRFFATQKMRPGYLANSRRQDKKRPYYPFYLTEAGSVFVLKFAEPATAENTIKAWQDDGLKLPKWVPERYGDGDTPLWKVCPYLPENGYGEVAVNLQWTSDELPSEGGAQS